MTDFTIAGEAKTASVLNHLMFRPADLYQPERLALTGATGALGFSFIKRIFQDHPHLQANLLVRQASSSFQSEAFQKWLQNHQDRVTLVEGDVRQLAKHQMDALLKTDGGLWHFAAVTSLTAECEKTAREIHEVNAAGTQRMADAWSESPGDSPFYHVSTAYVVGHRSGIIRETESMMNQEFRNPYEASKLKAENSINRIFAAGARGAIFRPSVVVDEGGSSSGIKMVDACAYALALALKRDEPFVFRMQENASINLIHSDWVIAAMVDLARLPSGSNVTYHLTAPRATYFRDIAAILETIASSLKVSFEPGLTRADLPSASKIFDKAVTEIKQYCHADIQFDRTNTERDISPQVKESEMDLRPFVLNRLKTEVAHIASRKQKQPAFV